MDTSLLLAIAAMLFFGIQSFLMQVAAKHGKNSFVVTAAMMATVSGIAVLGLVIWPQAILNWKFLLVLAVLDGVTHAGIIIAKIEGLRFLPASVYMPFHRAGTVVVILYGLVYLGESLSAIQIFGILLTFIVVFLAATDNKPGEANYRKGIWIAALGMVLSAVGNILMKTAADNVNVLAFTAIGYGLSSAVSFGARSIIPHNHAATWECARIGVLMGVLNAAGFFCMIYALKLGKASLTFPIIQLYVLVSILLAMVVYKERLDGRVGVEVGLTLVALLLLS